MDKISFNNFKAFGEKTQTFSKKPITLVYGPNSVGKSSFLHFMSYMSSIHKNNNLDVENIYMGETISLGGFKNFIHKKDKNSTIKLKYPSTWNSVLNSELQDIFHGETHREIGMLNYDVVDINIKFIVKQEILISAQSSHQDDSISYLVELNTNHNMIKEKIKKIKKNGNWTESEFNKAFNQIEPIKMILNAENNFFSIDIIDSRSFQEITTVLNNWTLEDENSKKRGEDYGFYFSCISEITLSLRKLLLLYYLFILSGIENLKGALRKTIPSNEPFSFLSNLYANDMQIHYIGPLRFYPDRGDTLIKIQKNRRANKYKNIFYDKSLIASLDFNSYYNNINSKTFWNELYYNDLLVKDINNYFSNKKLNLPYEIVFKKYYEHLQSDPDYIGQDRSGVMFAETATATVDFQLVEFPHPATSVTATE